MVVLVCVIIIFFLPGELYMRLDRIRTSVDIRLKRIYDNMTEYIKTVERLTENTGFKTYVNDLHREFDENKSYKKRSQRIRIMNQIHDVADSALSVKPESEEKDEICDTLNKLVYAMQNDMDDVNYRAGTFNSMRQKKLYALYNMPEIPEFADLTVKTGK